MEMFSNVDHDYIGTLYYIVCLFCCCFVFSNILHLVLILERSFGYQPYYTIEKSKGCSSNDFTKSPTPKNMIVNHVVGCVGSQPCDEAQGSWMWLS